MLVNYGCKSFITLGPVEFIISLCHSVEVIVRERQMVLDSVQVAVLL
jgi:hypothetical protein